MASGTRARRHERTRETILDAARALVLEKGVEKVSLRAIARAVDYSPAGLYEYFANKDALIAALALRVSVRLARHIRVALRKETDDAEACPPLVRLGLAYIQFAREHPEDFRLMFHHARSGRTSHTEEIPEESPFILVYQLVEEGVKAGAIQLAPGRAIDDIAYAFWSYCHGAATLQLEHLADYDTDFQGADRYALEAMLKGMQT